MLRISQASGCQYWCGLCQTPILSMAEGIALHRPLTGPHDATDLLIIHERCRESPMAKMLLPKSVKRPLLAVLDMADEAIDRGGGNFIINFGCAKWNRRRLSQSPSLYPHPSHRLSAFKQSPGDGIF